MKKAIGLFFLALSLQSCDDGDLEVKTFNFNNETVQECNSIYYIINGKEIMILELDKPEIAFLQQATPVDEPIIYPLTSNDQLVYRLYSDNVSSAAICSSVPPATPTVVSEYVASSGGQIEITTNILTNVSSSKSTKITYAHQIKLVNCNFSNGSRSLIYTDFIFGNYTASAQTNTMSYSFSDEVKSCTPNKVYRNNTNQVLTLDFTTNFPTTTGNHSITLNTDNKVISTLYTTGTSLNNTSICAATPLESIEEWTATEGTVQITTELRSENGVNYLDHTISLLNCNYKKGDLSYFHDQYDFGVYSVPE